MLRGVVCGVGDDEAEVGAAAVGPSGRGFSDVSDGGSAAGGGHQVKPLLRLVLRLVVLVGWGSGEAGEVAAAEG